MRLEALGYERMRAGVLLPNRLHAFGKDASANLSVYLGGVLALLVRELARHELEHAHAESPEVVLLIAINEGTNETGDDHEEIHAKEPGGDVSAGTGETEDVVWAGG